MNQFKNPKAPHQTLLKLAEEYGAKNLGHIYKAIYNCTPCGPSVGVTYYRNGHGPRTLHNSDLFTLPVDSMRGDDPSIVVVALHVSSIIEGVEACTEIITLDHDATPEKLWAAVEAINDEALIIWNATHGCETCADHFMVEHETGATPVWDQCPDCAGEGVIV